MCNYVMLGFFGSYEVFFLVADHIWRYLWQCFDVCISVLIKVTEAFVVIQLLFIEKKQIFILMNEFSRLR
jgi:hypothetical protein